MGIVRSKGSHGAIRRRISGLQGESFHPGRLVAKGKCKTNDYNHYVVKSWRKENVSDREVRKNIDAQKLYGI
jgi:hypothetical protein